MIMRLPKRNSHLHESVKVSSAELEYSVQSFWSKLMFSGVAFVQTKRSDVTECASRCQCVTMPRYVCV